MGPACPDAPTALQCAMTRDHVTTQRPTKITLGEMRSTGLRKLFVYCGDYAPFSPGPCPCEARELANLTEARLNHLQ